MDTLTITISTAFLTAVFGPIIVEWVKVKLISKNSNKDIVGESIDINEKVDNQLEMILEELKCDRICISQFHNGGAFYPTGKSIKKFSVFYERVTEGILSIKETFQNIPVSLFPRVFSTLYKEGELIIPDCSDDKNDCELFQIKDKQSETKSIYMLAIKDVNDNFIGILTISYYQKKHKLSLDEWIFLRQKIGVIGTILTDYLHRR